MSTLPVVMLGTRASDLVRVVKQGLCDDVTHIDVEALKRAVLGLKVPRRIGAARAHNKSAARKNLVELALRILGKRLARKAEAGRRNQGGELQFLHIASPPPMSAIIDTCL